MPFGLTNGPTPFQHYVSDALRVYLDFFLHGISRRHFDIQQFIGRTQETRETSITTPEGAWVTVGWMDG